MSTDRERIDLLADWVAIWQSEAASLALDPEWRQIGGQVPAFWAALAGIAGDGGGDGVGARAARSGPAPGTAAAGAALGAGGGLERRVAELERQLAELRQR